MFVWLWFLTAIMISFIGLFVTILLFVCLLDEYNNLMCTFLCLTRVYGIYQGGYVDDCHGVWRIQGSLAVSRGIGDSHLKQWVISEPETRALRIEKDCEFLILASDGLWDKVLTCLIFFVCWCFDNGTYNLNIMLVLSVIAICFRFPIKKL